MALNFDPTKKVRPPSSSVKIFEEPKESSLSKKEETPIEHHLDTNPTPINNGVEKVFKQETNSVELVSNENFNSVELVSKNTNGVEKVLEWSLKQGLDTIKSTPIGHHLDTIVGKEREFLFFLAKQCQKNGSLITPPLTIEKIKTVLSYSNDGIKTVVYRLSNKGLITRDKNKKGRAGWVCYSLKKEIYDQILRQEDFNNGVELVLKQALKQGLNEPYSNNSNLIKNYNNNEPAEFDFQIPENISALGISQKSLQAIVRDNFLSKDEVQQSLEHYSHDLSKNLVKLKSAQFIMGILRNKTPYISTHFAQDEAKAVQAEIARIKQIQSERVELAELQLREQFEDYKLKNPNFLEEIKSGNQFLRSSSPKILDEIAFGKFKELINTQSQNQIP